MRPLIQYDLDEPPESPSVPLTPSSHHSNMRRPPVKKRKRNHRNQQRNHQPDQSQKTPLQHWDDPENATIGVVYDEQEGSASGSIQMLGYVGDAMEEEEYEEATDAEEEEEEESRLLTHEEIWDDAALIDAWNSAEAEYEAYHGTSKDWKTEPVKKSPLWYNKPYTAPSKPGSSKPNASNYDTLLPQNGEPEPDTAPLDFSTFVPTHDPSLAVPCDSTAVNQSAMATSFTIPPPSTSTVSRDEAFNNALSAMYWSGYWTAVYHCQGQLSGSNSAADAVDENGIQADEDEDEADDLVPTQR